MWRALPFVLLAGCFAAPPPPALPTELGGCHPGSHGALSELACRDHADCLLCADPDERCGRLARRRDLALTNAACPPVPVETCGGAQAACCRGRCVVSLGAPPL